MTQPPFWFGTEKLWTILPANGTWQDWKSFMVAGLDIPTLGCWEITGKYGTDKLTYVIWVSP